MDHELQDMSCARNHESLKRLLCWIAVNGTEKQASREEDTI